MAPHPPDVFVNHGKNVLITGCSSGFGHALVPRFLERGWTVVATMRDLENRRDRFTQELQKYPDRLFLRSLDVTDEKERKETAEFVRTRLQHLDVLVNNAGYGLFGAVEDLSEKQLREQFDVNFFGAVFVTRELLPFLRESKGRILNISSVIGTFGMPLSSGYASSKFALEGLSECLYYEMKPFGVQVCLVKPGRHRTNFSQNMVWGEESQNPGSPYYPMTKRYLQRKDALSQKVVVPQENVVRAVLRLAEAKSIPLRYGVGKDTALVKAFQTLLPERWMTFILSKTYQKTLFPPSPTTPPR